MRYNKINLIYSVTENNVLGVNGKLPFMVPEDLKNFKELTTGNAVVMGRKTFDSLPESVKPLPDRLNLVLTNNYGRSVIDTELFLQKNNILRDLNLLKDFDNSIKENETILSLLKDLLDKISKVYKLPYSSENISDIYELKNTIQEVLVKSYEVINDNCLINKEEVFVKALFVNNIESVIDVISYSFLSDFIKKDNFEIFVIGGKKVLEDFADRADNIYLTKVYTTTPLVDKRSIIYGPDIDLINNFELIDSSGIKISSSGLKYEFLKYSKIEEIISEPYFGD